MKLLKFSKSRPCLSFIGLFLFAGLTALGSIGFAAGSDNRESKGLLRSSTRAHSPRPNSIDYVQCISRDSSSRPFIGLVYTNSDRNSQGEFDSFLLARIENTLMIWSDAYTSLTEVYGFTIEDVKELQQHCPRRTLSYSLIRVAQRPPRIELKCDTMIRVTVSPFHVGGEVTQDHLYSAVSNIGLAMGTASNHCAVPVLPRH